MSVVLQSNASNHVFEYQVFSKRRPEGGDGRQERENGRGSRNGVSEEYGGEKHDKSKICFI